LKIEYDSGKKDDNSNHGMIDLKGKAFIWDKFYKLYNSEKLWAD